MKMYGFQSRSVDPGLCLCDSCIYITEIAPGLIIEPGVFYQFCDLAVASLTAVVMRVFMAVVVDMFVSVRMFMAVVVRMTAQSILLVHGLMHPELGHFLLSPHPDDPMPQGICPYHGSCLEGLASGPAIEKRWGKSAKELPPDHPAWALEAHYLAQMCVAALMILSPEKIVLGGGVMGQKHLFPMIRKETLRLLNGYLCCVENLDDVIVPPACFPDSGLLGSLLLAKKALKK